MITLVYYELFDGQYSDKEQDYAEIVEEEGILILTEDINQAFDHIQQHQEKYPDDEIEYRMQFWIDGDIHSHSVVAPGEKMNENMRKLITDFVKKDFH